MRTGGDSNSSRFRTTSRSAKRAHELPMDPVQSDGELKSTWLEPGARMAAFTRKAWWLRQPEPVMLSAALAMGLHAAMLWMSYRAVPTGYTVAQRSTHHSVAMRIVSREGGLRSEPPTSQGTRLVNAGRTGETRYDASVNSVAQPVGDFIGLGSPLEHQPIPASAIERTATAGREDKDFFPRSALDIGPYPAQPVLIDYPLVDGGSGTRVSELSLFIDENGRVVRIRVDGPILPAAMEEAARLAFMGATFTPGQVDGLPVRSRIRVEVVFEEGSVRR